MEARQLVFITFCHVTDHYNCMSFIQPVRFLGVIFGQVEPAIMENAKRSISSVSDFFVVKLKAIMVKIKSSDVDRRTSIYK